MCLIDKYWRCADLCADYKERFNENVPFFLIGFYDYDTISEAVQQALDSNKKISEEEWKSYGKSI